MRIKILILLLFCYGYIEGQNINPLLNNQLNNQTIPPPTTQSERQQQQYNEGFFKDLADKNRNQDFTRNIIDTVMDSTDSVRVADSLALLDTMVVDTQKLEVYGRAFLQNQQLDYTSESALVPPPNYRIGPGDEIAINIWDGPQEQQVYMVDKDGSIFPQFLGKIYVQGLTFENLQSLLKSRYMTIVPSGTKVDVQLVKVRTVRVNVVGEVINPNSYSISAFGTALNVLAMAGGTTEVGSMRNIQIKRNGYTVYELDIYDFLASGGENNPDLYLENNDYIVVPVHKKTITAQGEWVRPMLYQLRDDENLQALLLYSGGVKSSSRKVSANLTRYGFDKRELITIPLSVYIDDEYIDFVLQDMDSIHVDKSNEEIEDYVSIRGAVQYPDTFEVMPGDRIYDLIQKAGGLKKDAYLKRAILQRSDSVNISNTINLSLENFDENSPENIELQVGDVLSIFSQSDFYTEKSIRILGAIKIPGTYRYTGKISLKDLILLAGGLTATAEFSTIEVSRIYDTIGVMDYVRTRPAEIYHLSIYPDLESDTTTENFELKPFDVVSIKNGQMKINQEVVHIYGEVSYPGPYPVSNSNKRVSQIFSRAGGLTSEASLKNATLYRDTLGKFYCNFPKALKYPFSKWDVILNDNDSIYVPDNKTFVTIRGAVLEPMSTFVNPDFTSIKDYISLAGGLTDRADSRKIYIQYRDGSYARPKTFWFYRFYPTIQNGGIITVPEIDPTSPSFIQKFGEGADRAWDRTMRLMTTLSAFASTTVTSVLTYLSINQN